MFLEGLGEESRLGVPVECNSMQVELIEAVGALRAVPLPKGSNGKEDLGLFIGCR